MQCQELVLVLVCTSVVRGIHMYHRWQSVASDGGDAGQPLFLTPYVERGDVAQGRRLARVNITDDLNVESYAGYFAVNATFDSNQFFWYFPAMSGNQNAPVVLWLQGGPGMSSLYGLLLENGPLLESGGVLERREVHWALEHHMIYIDNPVGVGFSFTNHSDGYCQNEVQVGEQLFSTLTQFFKLFPHLQKNKFFITGESYAGKYVPALAYTIHNKNPSAKVKINLKGLAIGNGLCDPKFQMFSGDYFKQIGLIDDNQLEILDSIKAKIIENIKQRKWIEADPQYSYLFNMLCNMSGFDFYYNYMHTKDYTDSDNLNATLQNSSLRKSIHVGDTLYDNGTRVHLMLAADIMRSTAPWISELLDHYNVLMYNGQLDILIPYPATVNFLRNLNFTGANEYKTAARHVWKVDGEVAGYYKQAGRLTEVLVRNAGHMVPIDQPKWALNLITQLTGASDKITFSST